MILFTTLSVAAIEDFCINDKTNCLLCLEHEGCSFCRSDSLCYNRSSPLYENNCQEKVAKRDQKCVIELGYDAKPSYRYAFGFTVLGVAILTDLILRICFYRKTNDEYSKI